MTDDEVERIAQRVLARMTQSQVDLRSQQAAAAAEAREQSKVIVRDLFGRSSVSEETDDEPVDESTESD